MTQAADRETLAAQTRWDQWQNRYQLSSRRSEKYAGVAAMLVFVAIVASLLMQLFARQI